MRGGKIPLAASQFEQAATEKFGFYGWVVLIAGTIGSVMMGPSQTFTIVTDRSF